MKIEFNGEIMNVKSELLSDVLLSKNLLNKKGIAIAVNEFVVSKANWTNFKLTENDKILIITATQGG